MKKFLSAAIATVMLASMSVSAFAATELTTSPSNGNVEGDYTIGINGTYVAGSDATEKISVDIAWESMNFTYTEGSSTYSPETHTTTTTAGSWSTDKPGITVTNHSNVAIDATMSFAATASGVIGTFYTKSGTDFTAITTEADQKLSLDSAEGMGENPPKDTLYFGISGAAITENKSLGAITVTIAKDAKVVTDETMLKAALEAGGKVKLAGNIELTEGINISVDSAVRDITLDLNGYSVKNAASFSGASLLQVTNESENAFKFIVRDSSDSGTGKIESENVSVNAIRVYSAEEDVGTEIVVESGTVSGYYALTLSGYAKATVNGGTLIGSSDNTESTALFLNGGNVSAVINGGTFRSSGQFAIRVTQTGNKLEITGGESIGNIGTTSGISPTITITGGTFTFDPSEYVDTDNYNVLGNPPIHPTSYTVKPKE